MNIPTHAIIRIASREEAERLNEFANMFMPGRSFRITNDIDFTDCYCDLDPDEEYFPTGTRATYRSWIRDFEQNNDPSHPFAVFVPTDPTMRFISLEEFFAICEINEDELEIGSVEDIL